MNVKLLQDKVIVLSGGTKGVGRGIAVRAAQEGARVVISGRDREAAAQVLSQIEDAGQEGLFVPTDLYRTECCAELFDRAMERFGKIDGFVNYSGIVPAASLLEVDQKQFDDIFAVNVRAAMFCAQNAVKYMQQGGGGSIIMVGSPHAWCGEKDRVAYACSKGALLTLTEHIAHHYAADQIRANYITMGWVPTEGELSLRKAQGVTEEEIRRMAAECIPMGRMQEVDDIVPGIIYLLSDYSRMVTGANLRMSGGLYIG